MKRDKELEKIKGFMKRFDEIEHFLWTGDLSEEALKRIRAYISARYKWLMDYFTETAAK
jgi:phage-related protein